ncbi:MAG TPA: MATE family efflux transporter [Paludibacteraceae bacterium]|nr:MATE family efflux transporter [Paludibacteraceae bacterium]HOL00519.1 MATE family efflux transporter [Paludibacteraceae bacterium]
MELKGLPLTLGTEKIRNLLIQYSLPAIIAMTASSLYNITDSIFIGHGVGALAISGLAITFPFMNLSAAFGSLVGVGAATLMSVRLGQKDYSTANQILGNVFVLNIIFGLAFAIISLIFLDPILYFFGASPATLPYAHDFMVIILIGNVITHIYLGLNGLLRSIGKPEKAMYATLTTVGLNLILNPLFIFGFKWGIRGSALATVLSQTILLIWQIKLFSDKENFIHFQKGIFKLNKRIVKESLAIGMSPFLMNAVGSIIVIVLNQSLIRHGGDLAVGAYGIINRVTFLFAMVVVGLNQGMQPIAGYNFGAQKFDRVNEVLKLTILFATAIMTVGFLIGELFPRGVASIFTKDKELIRLASEGLRITFIFFPIVGFQMVTTNFFQSIGMAGKAVFLSLTRQLIYLLPCLLIFPSIYGLKGVWYSMPVADLLATLTAAYMLFVNYRKNISKSKLISQTKSYQNE